MVQPVTTPNIESHMINEESKLSLNRPQPPQSTSSINRALATNKSQKSINNYKNNMNRQKAYEANKVSNTNQKRYLFTVSSEDED